MLPSSPTRLLQGSPTAILSHRGGLLLIFVPVLLCAAAVSVVSITRSPLPLLGYFSLSCPFLFSYRSSYPASQILFLPVVIRQLIACHQQISSRSAICCFLLYSPFFRTIIDEERPMCKQNKALTGNDDLIPSLYHLVFVYLSLSLRAYSCLNTPFIFH